MISRIAAKTKHDRDTLKFATLFDLGGGTYLAKESSIGLKIETQDNHSLKCSQRASEGRMDA